MGKCVCLDIRSHLTDGQNLLAKQNSTYVNMEWWTYTNDILKFITVQSCPNTCYAVFPTHPVVSLTQSLILSLLPILS